jgi:hypothetical protein
MQRTIRCSAIVAITWLLSVAVLISAAQFDVAQAKKGRAAALGCGKELQKHCSGMPVQANNMLECLQKNQEKLPPRCVAHANNVVRSCGIEMQCSIAKPSPRAKAIFSDA